MSYSKVISKKAKEYSGSSETVSKNAKKYSSVPVVQKAAEEELQMKTETTQFAGKEDELQMKSETAQFAGKEEELQMKTEATQFAGKEEELQMKSETAQFAGKEEELQMKTEATQFAGKEEELQMKSETAQLASPEEEIQKKEAPIQRRENKTGMPDNLKSGIENLSGMDMSDVKVHYNSSQPAQLSALAYAQGNDIHIGPGQEKHLAHEAWHVVQQRQGRVQATKQMKMGVAVNDDPGLEHEADVMGAKALSASSQVNQLKEYKTTTNNSSFQLMRVIQRIETATAQIAPTPAAVGILGGSWGLTFPENLALNMKMKVDNHQWVPDLQGITGRFSVQARLLPGVTEVTGPGGNSNAGNYAAQVTDLKSLGDPPNFTNTWYMLQAVKDHEAVHQSQLKPALDIQKNNIKDEFDGLNAPINLNQNQALAQVSGSPAYTLAVNNSYNRWLNEVLRRVATDHNGRTAAAERRVVNPMVNSINDEAVAQGWGPAV